MSDTLCLGTKLRNSSGGSRFFGYLGRRGTTLAAGGTYTVYGDIFSEMRDGSGKVNVRKKEALESDLLNNKIEVIYTPGVILYDAVTGNARQLRLNNNSLDATDPCFGSYSGPG